MLPNYMRSISSFLTLAALAGCTLDVPVNPGGLFSDLAGNLENLSNQAADAAADPLGVKPFPRLFQSDGQQLFYATNLTQIQIRFRGRGNDLALPSILGPTNIYELVNRDRQVVSLLQPTLGVVRLDTDGEFLVALQAYEIAEGEFRTRVVSENLFTGVVTALYEPPSGEFAATALAIAGGKVAYAAVNLDTGDGMLRIVDLHDMTNETEIDIGGYSELDLRDNRLVYLDTSSADINRIMLRNIISGETTVIAEEDGYPSFDLTANKVVWALYTNAGLRVSTYDIPTGETRVITEDLPGEFAGASDDFVLSEEWFTVGDNGRNRLAVWRESFDGARKKIAEFDADGFAGQTRVVGDDAVWVNPERRIVLQPLAGGDRKIIEPF